MSSSSHHRVFVDFETQLLDGGGARCVWCVSELVRRELAELHPSASERLELVPNGVDLGAFDPRQRAVRGPRLREHLSITADAPILAFAGSDPRLKGLPTLLRALAELRRPWTLVAAGLGHPAAGERLARRFGVPRARARFLGAIDARDLLAAADLVCAPTWRDPSSLFQLEALAAGVPVITTRASGEAATIEAHPGAGRVFEDPSDADTLRFLLGEELERIAAGEPEREAVRASVRDRGSAPWLERMEARVRSMGV